MIEVCAATVWDGMSCASHTPRTIYAHTVDRAITAIPILCGRKKTIQCRKKVEGSWRRRVETYIYGALMMDDAAEEWIGRELATTTDLASYFILIIYKPY